MTRLDLTISGPAATARLGHFIAAGLTAGDVVALNGPLGAGKSVLARAVIWHLCPHEHDIPSPTFTLVQTYEPATGPALMHFDLYRLESPEEALELGIEDAFVESICLVEWAQRLGVYRHRGALDVTIEPDARASNMRAVSLIGGARWTPVLEGIRATMMDQADGILSQRPSS